MTTPAVAGIVQLYPAGPDVGMDTAIVTVVQWIDQVARTLVDPDTITLTIHYPNQAATTSQYGIDTTLTKQSTGVYEKTIAHVAGTAGPGKLRLTWRAVDVSGAVMGESESVVNLVAQLP